MDISKELKAIERDEVRLAKEKKRLIEQEKQVKAREAKLEALVKQSGFESPKKLVEALIAKYSIRFSGRKPGKTTKSGKARRKRTTITAKIRDDIKAQVKGGDSMNQVSKQTGISYAVVVKICNGHYDAL